MKPYVALFVALFSISVEAQQPAPAKVAPVPKAPQAPTAPLAPKPPAAPAPVVRIDPSEGGQPVNIRLDVSVIDQEGGGVAEPKMLTVILADRALGQTRAAFQDRTIAVDARPTTADGRIRVQLTVQSDETRTTLEPLLKDHTMNWRNSFSLLLENGKPITALETADAANKRKLSIEVKATILK